MFVAIFLGTTIFVLLIWHLHLRYFSGFVRQTSHVPGPQPLPFVGNFFDLGSSPSELFAAFFSMWKQYGNTFKIVLGPKYFIFTADPKHLQVLLSNNTNISKGISYTYLEPWLGKGLLTSTGSKWRKHRKLLTPAFHFTTLEKSLDSFEKNGRILVKNLEKHVNGEAFNIYEYINLNTLDVICDAALGISVNAQTSVNSEYVTAVKGLAAVFVERLVTPWLHFDNFFFKWSPAGRKQGKYLRVLHSMSKKVIRERKEEFLSKVQDDDRIENNFGSKKGYAFLDLLLQYSRTGGTLTEEEIREEVDTFMFEGHDTTASAMSFCLLMLSLHSDIQEKVFDEQKIIFGPENRSVTRTDLNEMKYLECVIKESLRLYPSVPFFSRELDSQIQLDDFELPAGTNVTFMIFCLHRNPDIYPDPDKFDPDRFLPENSRGIHPFAYLPFSAGPRNCIGQKFAMMELKAVISKLLRSYKFIASENIELELSWEFVLRSTDGIFMKIQNR